MALYKLTNSPLILRTSDGTWIPPDVHNADYEAYLAWLAMPNTPDPADPLPVPLTPQQVAAQLLNDPGYNGMLWRGLITALATQLGKTPVQIFNAIVNAAN